MNSLSSKFIPTDNAFVDEKALTIASILVEIGMKADLAITKKRDLKSALRSLCRLINKQPEEVPANINWVHIRLRRVHPAAHNITKKRLANIKSGVLKALEITGCSRKRSDWLRKPLPAWQTLLDKIPEKHDRWKLSQLAQYCSALNIVPDEVNDHHILGLLEVLAKETFTDKPDQVAVYAAKTWNCLKDQIDGWPDTELKRPPKRKEPWTTPLEQFLESLQVDIEHWLDRLANPDPLSSDGPFKPLRPVTVKHRRHQIQQMCSALVLAGHSIEAITSLAYLVDIQNFKDGVRQLMSRFGNKPTEAIHGLTIGLKAIAAHYVKVDEGHLEELKRICQRLNLEVDGLREKNQQRLLQLEDPHNFAKLLHLPEKLVKLSKRPGQSDHKAALMVQAALAIEILLYAPMRINNLASLNIEEHIRRLKVKRENRVQIYIPATEVKNDRALHYELGSQTTALLDYYLQKARPILLREPTDYLFPAQNGDRKRNGALSGLIKQMILEHTGLTINAHLFRSIAGKIHSIAAPGDFVTLSHVIGDSLKTAMKSYAQFEQKNSLEHYQRSVDQARSQLVPGKTRQRSRS
jgi:integrase